MNFDNSLSPVWKNNGQWTCTTAVCDAPKVIDTVTKQCVDPPPGCDLSTSEMVNGVCAPKCSAQQTRNAGTGQCEDKTPACASPQYQVFNGVRAECGQCPAALDAIAMFKNNLVDPVCKDGTGGPGVACEPIFVCGGCLTGYEKVAGVCVPICQPGETRNAQGECKPNTDKPKPPTEDPLACMPGTIKNTYNGVERCYALLTRTFSRVCFASVTGHSGANGGGSAYFSLGMKYSGDGALYMSPSMPSGCNYPATGYSYVTPGAFANCGCAATSIPPELGGNQPVSGTAIDLKVEYIDHESCDGTNPWCGVQRVYEQPR